MDYISRHEIKAIWKKEIIGGLGMGTRMFIGSLLVMIIFWNGFNMFTLSGAFREMPEVVRADFFPFYIEFFLYFMSLGCAAFLAWLMSFQLFAVEKEEKIFETLLAGPLQLPSIYIGKILAFLSLFVPSYFLIYGLGIPLVFLVADKYLLLMPKLDIPSLCWINAFLMAPLLGTGLAAVLGVIQLISKNPRIPSMIVMWVLSGFFIGAGMFKDQLIIDERTTAIIGGIVALSILVPLGIVLKGYVRKERVILPG